MFKTILLGSILLLAGCGGNTETAQKPAEPSQPPASGKKIAPDADNDDPIVIADSGISFPPPVAQIRPEATAKDTSGSNRNKKVKIKHKGIHGHPETVDEARYKPTELEFCKGMFADDSLRNQDWTADFRAGSTVLFRLKGKSGSGEIKIKYVGNPDTGTADNVSVDGDFDNVLLTVGTGAAKQYPKNGWNVSSPMVVQIHYCNYNCPQGQLKSCQ